MQNSALIKKNQIKQVSTFDPPPPSLREVEIPVHRPSLPILKNMERKNRYLEVAKKIARIKIFAQLRED